MKNESELRAQLNLLKVKLEILSNTMNFVSDDSLQDKFKEICNKIDKIHYQLIQFYIAEIGNKLAFNTYLKIRYNSNLLNDLAYRLNVPPKMLKNELHKEYLERSEEYNS